MRKIRKPIVILLAFALVFALLPTTGLADTAVDFSVTTAVSPTTVLTGGIVELTIYVYAPARTAGITTSVTCSLPDGINFVSATDGGTCSAGTVTWSATVPAGAEGTVLTLGVNCVAQTQGTKSFTASVSTTGNPDPNTDNDTDTATINVVTERPLKPTATSPQYIGDTGANTLADLQATVGDGYDLAWFASDSSMDELPLTTPLADGTTYYARTSNDGLYSSDSTPVKVNLVPAAPSITIESIEADKEFLPAVGDDITYIVTVKNTGNVLITFAGIESTPSLTATSPRIDLNPGNSAIGTCTYEVTQADLDTGSFTFEAYAEGVDSESNTITSSTFTKTVNIEKVSPTVTGTISLNGLQGMMAGDATVTATLSNAYFGPKVTGIPFTAKLGTSNVAATATASANGNLTFSFPADKLNTLNAGAHDILVSSTADTHNNAVANAKVGTLTITAPDPVIILDQPDPTKPLDLMQNAVFRLNKPYNTFAYAKINGNLLTSTPQSNVMATLANYPQYPVDVGDAREGSTTITLYKEFLQWLPDGKYTLEVGFLDGSVEDVGSLNFEIKRDAQPTPTATAATTTSPQTGDESNLSLWIALCMIAGVSIAGVVSWRRKRSVK
ncbi:DUF11 domain-containing protein [Christensenellaceae bacterium OttesenSCG-928-K19]|nr:DUF11 domain-containing protein [Christensenellaceae bacterium OttesenSCG-928-K19]